MNLQPIEIKRLPNGILIRWRDELQREYSYPLLRQKCPCARCQAAKEDKNPFRILPSDDFFRKLQVIDIQLVGRYAIRLIWNDGHKTGIYPFELLRSLRSDEANFAPQ